jgi:hypothetical protein
MTGQDADLPYRIEVWDEHDTHVEELVALIGDHAVARAAYEETVRRRLGRNVTLKQKTGVLAESKGTALDKESQ